MQRLPLLILIAAPFSPRLSRHSAVYFSLRGLHEAHVYYKRSFTQTTLLAVPHAHKHKLRPFGLSVASLASESFATAVIASTKVFIRHVLTQPRSWEDALKRLYSNAYYSYGLPRTHTLRFDLSAARENVVLFQTRLWDPKDNARAPDVEKVNSERADFVRRLRAALGSRFIGGIVPDAFSRRFCPDVLAAANTSREDYLALTRRSAIGVFTRGLHGSLGNRLSEYLALGSCIVSEPLTEILPAPLREGENYEAFASVEDCIAKCELLLSDPARVTAMRNANAEYYKRWCEPKSRMRWLLQDSMGERDIHIERIQAKARPCLRKQDPARSLHPAAFRTASVHAGAAVPDGRAEGTATFSSSRRERVEPLIVLQMISKNRRTNL